MHLSRWWPAHSYLTEPLRLELEAAYADPSRGYHDTRHLVEVCQRLDELASAGVTYAREPVLLAAWFHDAIYDGQPHAEERSAQWAERSLSAADPALAAEASRLVRLTADHQPEVDDVNGCALVDADLAILAADPARYRVYAADVRREYAFVSDEDFAAGRSQVLTALLGKPTLFHTAYAQRHWEEPARANVTAEVCELRAILPPS